MPPYPTCSIPECNGRHRSRGWCEKHYDRWRRHGDPLITLTPARVIGTKSERFWAKVDCSNEDGCWLWMAALTRGGYGQFYDGRVIYAHRWAYE